MSQTVWYLIKEDTQMASKHMKRCSMSYVISEMQIETMRCHCESIQVAKIQNTATSMNMHSYLFMVGKKNGTAT